MTSQQFQHHYTALYLPLGLYALRMVRDLNVAQDLVQEAFLTVWQKITDGFEPQNFKAYMYVTVRNAALVYLRNANKLVSIDEAAAEVAPEDIDRSEMDAQIWRAVDALAPRCREIFLLSKRDGLSHAQIAEKLNISVKTIENQITKANKALRGSLAYLYNDNFILFFL